MDSLLAAVVGFILGISCFGGGLYIGWTVRDKVGVLNKEIPSPLYDQPLDDYTILSDFVAVEKEDDELHF